MVVFVSLCLHDIDIDRGLTPHKSSLISSQRSGIKENGTNPNREMVKIINGGKNSDYSLSLVHQFFGKNLAHS